MTQPALILFRHGNTFEAGQTATWVGARTDMPLTAEGEEQAKAAAQYARQHAGLIDALLAGPLQRTRRFADIIGEAIDRTATIDERLREIDYGSWEDLDGESIRQQFGAAPLDAWQEKGIWPEGMNWSPSLETLQNNLGDFLQAQHEKLNAGSGSRLAVTSNGILRLVYQIVTGHLPNGDVKVKTGNYCVLVSEDKGWKIREWNKKP
jgi:probable phosphoglycerate mutase